ncbi:pyruvate decarboxylase [Trichoderma guizhouense]|uniref:Pyruvate decarboxylase n=1 Tax=Trichoderma guizhouense TaxID=1491466 RepID=A0A1T3CRP2_9HYPO|nr:pyruvate decarboxylase [Trichoderma guizhouense]
MAEIRIGEYLFRRLKQMGIETAFGVPGDYELALLNYVEPAGLNWIGTPNELVGAYAADGYARLKGAAALVTTFGPGELSALCGLGGSFCEMVPVLHIVGYPSFAAQASGQILHHTLGDKSYDHYVRMSSELSCATAVLKDPSNATAEIDRVLNAMMYHSQPGYIGITEDVVKTLVPASSLDATMIHMALSSGTEDDRALAAIMAALEVSKNPIVIVDGGAGRSSWASHAIELVKALKSLHFNTVMGKGIVGEDDPLFAGCYAGVGSLPATSKAVEQSDCILWLGYMPSDFNTGMFTEDVKSSLVIDFQRFHITVGQKQFQARMNTRLSSFVKPGDMIVAETGTSQIGALATKTPQGVYYWTQAVWGSIGYAIGAAVGAAIAGKELGQYRRMIVFTGEGSLQLTVQAMSILNRHGVVPYVYTVERYFEGWDAAYNDVPEWDYSGLFRSFAPNLTTNTVKARSAAELDKLLSEESFQNATIPQCIDMTLDKYDAPAGLRAIFDFKKKMAGA